MENWIYYILIYFGINCLILILMSKEKIGIIDAVRIFFIGIIGVIIAMIIMTIMNYKLRTEKKYKQTPSNPAL